MSTTTHKQDDGVVSTLEEEVDLTDSAQLLPSPCPQQQDVFADRYANSGESHKEGDQLATRSDASSQTGPDQVREAMSDVVSQLEQTRELLAAKEVMLLC